MWRANICLSPVKGSMSIPECTACWIWTRGKTLNILFDCISNCIFSQRDFAFNWMCCTQALCSLTNIFPLATSQPTGGLALNPSQQIQLLDSPRGGRGAAISTKGIIDIIKLSVYSRNSILYHKQMYGSNPCKPSVGITQLIMMKVTLLWRVGWAGFTNVAEKT